MKHTTSWTIERVTVRGFLLAACTALMALQSFGLSAASTFAPGTVSTWGGGSPHIALAFPVDVVPVDVSASDTGAGFAITRDGALYGWFGVSSASPIRIDFPAPVTAVYAVSMRASHTLALTDDGLYAWGFNSAGELGDGTTTAHSTPAKVLLPAAVTSVTAIAAGYAHSLAVTNDGLYAWGDNWNGELGDGTRINRSLPVKVAFPSTVTAVSEVAAGRNTSYAITDDGLYAWGNDFAGQLGNGSFGILPNGDSDVGQALPVKVRFNTFANNRKSNTLVTSVSAIAAGENYAMAITNDGLYAWGMNLAGNLGIGATTGNQSLPVKVKFPKAVTSVKAIAAAVGSSFAVTNDGLYAWGRNDQGQLGMGGISSALTPVKVPGEDNAIDVGAAEYSTVALH